MPYKRAKRQTMRWSRQGKPARSRVPIGAPLHRVRAAAYEVETAPTVPRTRKDIKRAIREELEYCITFRPTSIHYYYPSAYNSHMKTYFEAGQPTREIMFDDYVDLTTFVGIVKDAFEHRFGELKTIPVSFREEIYRNPNVSLRISPWGGEMNIEITYPAIEKIRGG